MNEKISYHKTKKDANFFLFWLRREGVGSDFLPIFRLRGGQEEKNQPLSATALYLFNTSLLKLLGQIVSLIQRPYQSCRVLRYGAQLPQFYFILVASFSYVIVRTSKSRYLCIFILFPSFSYVMARISKSGGCLYIFILFPSFSYVIVRTSKSGCLCIFILFPSEE